MSPTIYPVPAELSGKALDLTLVGTHPVVLDPASRNVLIADTGAVVRMAEFGASLELQQPGPFFPDAARVVLGTSTGLAAIALDGDQAVDLGERARAVKGAGSVTAPVVVGRCIFGAFLESAAVIQVSGGCRGRDVVRRQLLTATGEVVKPGDVSALTYRVNRGLVVLNDAVGGGIWNADDDKLVQRDDWTKPPANVQQKPTEAPRTSEPLTCKETTTNHLPQPKADFVGARPEVPVVIDVLGNDSDADCDVLAILGTPKLVGPGTLVLVGDGRLVQVTPARGTNRLSFEYLVTDGRPGAPQPATVTIEVKSGNSRPVLRTGVGIPSTVVVRGKSVSYAVLGDYLDPEGDPLQLVGAETPGGQGAVRFQPDGLLTYDAIGVRSGKVTVTVHVSDGRGGVADGRLVITVREPGEDLKPTARPDYLRAPLNVPTTIDALANDSDPNGDTLRLQSLRVVEGDADLKAEWDADSGVVTVTGSRLGSYPLEYKVSAGRSTAVGRIRVDVVAVNEARPPAPALDMVGVVRAGETVVDVLANDFDPNGDVLAVTAVSSSSEAVLVSVQEGRRVRVQLIQSIREPVIVRYQVTDGGLEATGTLLVSERSGDAAGQPPLARPDELTVRAGQTVTLPVLANDATTDGGLLVLGRDLVSRATRGEAFVNGPEVRYLAPTTAGRDEFDYRLTSSLDPTAGSVGHVTVSVLEANTPNRAPKPVTVEARVVRGAERVPIAVPLVGIDPDGDTVELDSARSSGGFSNPVHVDRASQKVLYSAIRPQSGTDQFRYHVCDVNPKPLCVDGIVRVLVYERASNERPTAVPDSLVVGPGRTFSVSVLDNDTDPDGDTPMFAKVPLGQIPAGFTAQVSGRAIVVTTPDVEGSAVIPYRIVDKLHRDSPVGGQLRLRVSKTAPLYAPIARDDVVGYDQLVGLPKSGAVVSVDVLANDLDPDGTREQLTIAPVGGVGAVSGGKLDVPVTSSWQALPYQVRDLDGNVGTAVVIVPPNENVAPQPRIVDPVHVKAGESRTFEVADVASDGGDGPGALELASSEGLTSTLGPDAVTADSPTAFTFRAPAMDENPPSTATITVPVTDDGRKTQALVDVPVVIDAANRNPVFTPTSVQIEIGDQNPAPQSLQPSVNDPDAEEVGKPVTFVAISGQKVTGIVVSLTSDGQLTAVAPTGVQVGAGGSIKVAFTNGREGKGEGLVTIEVVRTTKSPLIAVDLLHERLDQGTAATVDVAAANENPFVDEPNASLKLVDVRRTSGRVGAVAAGTSIQLTAVDDSPPGLSTISYTLEDNAGRRSSATLRVYVWGIPTNPGAVQEVRTTGSSVTLEWVGSQANAFTSNPDAPSDPAASAIWYELSCTPVAASCGTAAAKKITTTQFTVEKLTPGEPYIFTIRAVNVVGTSAGSSSSIPITPDALPSTPVLAPESVPDDFGADYVVLHWHQPAAPDGGASPISSYKLMLSSADAAGLLDRVISGSYAYGGDHTARVAGLVNGQSYELRLCPVNKVEATKSPSWDAQQCGSAPSARTPIGLPLEPGPVTLDGVSNDPVVGRRVTATWGAVPQASMSGDSSVTYSCQLFKGSAPVGAVKDVPSGTTCFFDGLPDGMYTVGVSTVNRKGTSAADSRSNPATPLRQPDGVSSVSATATRTSNQVRIAFSPLTSVIQAGGAQPSAVEYFYDVASDGNWRGPIVSGVITTNGFQNGTTARVRVIARNGSGADSTPASAAADVMPVGTVSAPSAGAARNGVSQVVLSWGPQGDAVAVKQFNIRVLRNGAQVDAFASGPGGSRAYDNGTNVTWQIVVDAVGFDGATASSSASVVVPPPPTAEVYNWGRVNASTVQCSVGWSWVGIRLTNFPAGATIALSLQGNVHGSGLGWGDWSGYGAQSVVVDGAGNYTGRINVKPGTPNYFACVGTGVDAQLFANGGGLSATSGVFTF
jgi:hypothetical protein